jgi:NitT/TauT family transport system substrate-binding protein
MVPGLRRRSLVLGVPAVLAGNVLGAAAAIAQQRVVFGLDWQLLGRHAGFIAAAEKGFYRQVGLDVEIQRGYGSAEVVKRVASGAVTFGFGDLGALIVARSEGIEVKAVAVVYGKTPYALWIRQDAGIEAPKDLEGKVIGATAASAVRLLFPAFATVAGVDASKVTWKTIDAAAYYPMLMTGEVDAIVDMVPGWPTAERLAAEAHVALRAMRYADYGLDIYGSGLLARDSDIADNPDLVQRFVKATLRGLQYAFDHPDEAVALLLKRRPDVDAETAVGEIKIVRELALTPEAKAHGLGYMSASRVAATRDVIGGVYLLKSGVAPGQIFTNAFIAARPGDAR